MEYRKVKSVAKSIQTRGPGLEKTVLRTMAIISDIVGGTLGPGGRPVLIEREEPDLPPMVTKDGVTVFRSLGFSDAASHSVMETARDASVRTASEAGDGTTTATILAESIVRRSKEYCSKNPRVSPQKVCRKLESVFRDVIEPELRGLSIKADTVTNESRVLLQNVARVSANGDSELAGAVMKCFDLVGDDGNVTISEVNGPSAYEIEKVEGYPITSGYEESCAKFYPKFINDVPGQRVVLEKPQFLLYHGRITEFQSLVHILDLAGQRWQAEGGAHNIVIVATGFSEQVLNFLALNFPEPNTLNVFPLLVPQSPFPNGQLYVLQDLAAITGAKLLDSISAPLEQALPEDLGPGVASFESGRFRSNIVGFSHDPEGERQQKDLILIRVDELEVQLSRSESTLDKVYLQERIGKLTGGIARLKVIGASNGETKEKRDRAEDAVCAVRGAIRHGCLPGGGWGLLRLMNLLKNHPDPIIREVLVPALFEPVLTLYHNAGIFEEEMNEILKPVIASIDSGQRLVYDLLAGKHVDAIEGGILDSTPAVLEAIRNSLSIAALLGTLGGTVCFPRDETLERSESSETKEWLRNANVFNGIENERI